MTDDPGDLNLRFAGPLPLAFWDVCILSEHSMKAQISKAPGKREQQAVDRRNQLIDVALHLFSSKGYEGSTIKELAEAGGVAQGLFYHYFPSKEELLLAVFERHGFLAELQRRIEPSNDKPARQVLLEVAQAHYNLMVEKEELVRILVRESITNESLNARWMSMCREGVVMLSKYLDARVAAGELKPHNTDMSARMILHPVIMLRLTGDSARALPDLVACLMDGIGVEK